MPEAVGFHTAWPPSDPRRHREGHFRAFMPSERLWADESPQNGQVNPGKRGKSPKTGRWAGFPTTRGSITLGELRGKLDMLEVAYHRCEPRGGADWEYRAD